MIFLLTLFLFHVNGKVIELSLTTMEDVLEHNYHALVLFYKPNVNLYEEYLPYFEKASDEFENNKNVIFGKFNCDVDEHKEVCESQVDEIRFSFMFYFMGSKKTEVCTSGKEYLAQFVEERLVATDLSYVIPLNVKNFESVAMDPTKNVVVKFFAPWCGHCKALAPTYIEVSAIFAGEKDLVIAEVDCEANSEICDKYEVMGYPTIMIFDKNNKVSEYTDGREVNEFIQAFNNIMGYQRTFDGGLSKRCGRIDSIEDKLFGFMGKKTEEQNEIIGFAQSVDGGDYYARILTKIQKDGNKEFVYSEKKRITKNLNTHLTPEQRDKYLKKLNILDAF